MKYYKILNEEENHNGLQFRTGRVDDPVPFEEYGTCVPGGIYFAPVTSVLSFVHIGPWIREITIPKDAQMVRDPQPGPKKYRASSVILGERERWMDVFPRLLDEGADVNADKGIPLSIAANNGDIDVVKLFLRHGYDIHSLEDAPLRWAVSNNRIELVKFLLDNGADVHVRYDEPLRWAVNNGYVEITKILLEHGADVHVRGDEPIRCAAENGYTKVAEILIKYGADVYASYKH